MHASLPQWTTEQISADFGDFIADRSYTFARDHLMMEDVFLYFYLVLKEYASLQTLDAKQLRKETLAHPR